MSCWKVLVGTNTSILKVQHSLLVCPNVCLLFVLFYLLYYLLDDIRSGGQVLE